MNHEVPIGNMSQGNGFIGNAGTSQIIYWVNIISTTTPANISLFSFTNNTTATNLIMKIGTGGRTDHLFQSFGAGLLADNGCYLTTSASCSMANVGYRSYSG